MEGSMVGHDSSLVGDVAGPTVEDLETGVRARAPQPSAAAQAAMKAFDGATGSSPTSDEVASQAKVRFSIQEVQDAFKVKQPTQQRCTVAELHAAQACPEKLRCSYVELQEVLKTWDTDGDGTVDMSELQSAARQYLEHKRHVVFLKKLAVALVFAVLFLVASGFTTTFGANEVTKEVKVDHAELVGVGSDHIVETAPAVERSLDLRHAAVLDMAHLRTVDEVSYSLGDPEDDAHKMTETVIAVVVENNAGWPTVKFHTALRHVITVDPVSIVVQRGGEAVHASMAPGASSIRCDRFTVDDPGLSVPALDAALAAYAQDEGEQSYYYGQGAGRRAEGLDGDDEDEEDYYDDADKYA